MTHDSLSAKLNMAASLLIVGGLLIGLAHIPFLDTPEAQPSGEKIILSKKEAAPKPIL